MTKHQEVVFTHCIITGHKVSVDVHASMKNSSHSKYENGDYCSGYEFDPQTDFIQFLEEARRYAADEELDPAPSPPPPPHPKDPGEKRHFQIDKRQWKSWKVFLFSLLNPNKNKPPGVKPSNNATVNYKQKRAYVSGPIQRSSVNNISWPKRTASGPQNLFGPARTVEDQIPYKCLQRLNDPRELESYGPVYLVT